MRNLGQINAKISRILYRKQQELDTKEQMLNLWEKELRKEEIQGRKRLSEVERKQKLKVRLASLRGKE